MALNIAAHGKYTLLHLALARRSHIGATHFRKVRWFQFFESVEYCIAATTFKYWSGIVQSYIDNMFKLLHNTYNLYSKAALDIILQQANIGQQTLSSLWQITWTKITHITENVKTAASSVHNLIQEIWILNKPFKKIINLIILFPYFNASSFETLTEAKPCGLGFELVYVYTYRSIDR